MRRRAVLASASTLLASGIAGCMGASPAGPEPSSTTRDATTTAAGPSVSVTFDRLQPAVLVATADAVEVRGVQNQYVFVHVDVTDGEPPDRLEFGFRLGGRTSAPGVTVGETLWRERAEGGRYDADSGAGWLVFEIPANWDARHAVFSLGSREWPVGGALRDRLSNPAPDRSLTWEVPETAPPGKTPMEFTVENEGERDTRFVAVLSATGSLDAEQTIAVFNRRIPGDEAVFWDQSVEGLSPDSTEVDDGERDVTFELEWTGGVDQRSVRHVESSD